MDFVLTWQCYINVQFLGSTFLTGENGTMLYTRMPLLLGDKCLKKLKMTVMMYTISNFQGKNRKTNEILKITESRCGLYGCQHSLSTFL
jgi:hypothetical protein